ncbi:hypothetical protein CYMTET_3107 [Cymbomonas tetramitiformis]|uniref:Uncharacterized protein n=1 Tax=Cymbomonas tetramitiformis TaxID=36881 RepID=A0AAE0H458_9CHLO|nr:hypothetical protein CYMTET_3107 [Cymbomonas tetramitiformis]
MYFADSEEFKKFEKLEESEESESDPEPTTDDEYDEQVIECMMYHAKHKIWADLLSNRMQRKTKLKPNVVFRDFQQDPAIEELLKAHLKSLRTAMDAFMKKVASGGIDPKTLRERDHAGE